MLIAIVIFSAVVLSLAGLSFQIARRSTRATNQALIMAAQISGADRATAVPYDSLSTLLTPDTVMSGPVRVIVRYVIDSISAVRKDVSVIASTSVPGTNADTIVIRRGRVRYAIPLK